MSIEKIVAEAIDNNPLQMKAALEEEMNVRIRAALQEKYREMTEGVEAEDEELLEAKVECPKCEGEGCDHCDGQGFHMVEAKAVAENDDEDEDEDEDDEDEGDEDEDEDDMDEAACVKEMQKLHASSCTKREMFDKVAEKYGCSESKFNELYAQYCK